MAISVTIEERDALRELVRSHMGSPDEIWAAVDQGQWDLAKFAFDEALQNRRLLQCLGAEESEDGRVDIDIRPYELRDLLFLLDERALAQLRAEESPGDDSPERKAEKERTREAIRICERLLDTLVSRHVVFHVVVDSATKEAATPPIFDRDSALDMVEALNENPIEKRVAAQVEYMKASAEEIRADFRARFPDGFDELTC
ncbi:MAG TPA: hypothetical protein VHU86_09095 [Solirubrobacterales bacterium]|jgi:hypothetical protein|nr:hypothetical protein [Solirubrobacterales bacterium]